MTIPKDINIQDWSRQMLAVDGVDELVVMAKEQVAYLKLDKRNWQILHDKSCRI